MRCTNTGCPILNCALEYLEKYGSYDKAVYCQMQRGSLEDGIYLIKDSAAIGANEVALVFFIHMGYSNLLL